MKTRKAIITVTIFLFIMASFFTSCGHMANPAPPKVELTSTKDHNLFV